MENGKEKKPKESPNRNPLWDGPTEIAEVGNRLALPPNLKKYLADHGMDYRFLNAQEFRAAGNYHRSDWRPFKAPAELITGGLHGVNAEGNVVRGDLILGIRPKVLSAKHKEIISARNKRYANFAKDEAKRMKDVVREKGLGDHVTVQEGYGDDNEKGYT